MQKLKASEVASYRATKLEEQQGCCALCGDRMTAADVACLDHDHKTGACRGTLHRGCNAMLGHIENNRPRHGLLGARLGRMLRGVEAYIHADYSQRPLHPTHRTSDEKRILTNKRAVAARAKKKASA